MIKKERRKKKNEKKRETITYLKEERTHIMAMLATYHSRLQEIDLLIGEHRR